MSLTGDEVFDCSDGSPRAVRAGLNATEVKPELPWSLVERNGDRDTVGRVCGFLNKTDDVLVVDLSKRQIARLLKRRVVAAYSIDLGNVVLDVSRLVPIPHFDLVLLGIPIFFATGHRFMLEQLEPIVDPVGGGQRCREDEARLEHPLVAALGTKW